MHTHISRGRGLRSKGPPVPSDTEHELRQQKPPHLTHFPIQPSPYSVWVYTLDHCTSEPACPSTELSEDRIPLTTRVHFSRLFHIKGVRLEAGSVRRRVKTSVSERDVRGGE